MTMKFEDQIKQEKFSSNFGKAVLNLKYTSHWYNAQEAQVFKKYDILSQHYNVLRIVIGKSPDPVYPNQILKVMLDPKRDLTRLVDKLVRLDYLTRSMCPTSRRSVVITVTAKGKRISTKIDKDLMAFLDHTSNLNEKESQQLSNLLDKLRG